VSKLLGVWRWRRGGVGATAEIIVPLSGEELRKGGKGEGALSLRQTWPRPSAVSNASQAGRFRSHRSLKRCTIAACRRSNSCLHVCSGHIAPAGLRQVSDHSGRQESLRPNAPGQAPCASTWYTKPTSAHRRSATRSPSPTTSADRSIASRIRSRSSRLFRIASSTSMPR
jgi:hypothetical protein